MKDRPQAMCGLARWRKFYVSNPNKKPYRGTVSTDHSTNQHTLIKMHYNVGIISTFLFLLKISIAFRLEIDINRQQTEQNGCGCEEKSNLINLRSKILTPQDFMRDHGKLWLGSIEASITKDCIKLCPIKSARTSHFTFESKC